MSYEGYEQYLCADGHYWTEDCWTIWNAERPSCPFCKKPAISANSVDQTNGPDVGRVVLEEVAPAKTCKCEGCGNVHIIEPTRFKFKTTEAGDLVYEPIEEEPNDD